ncbi:hypothetical protein, partial [Sulfitobacter sp.]|uniref:hypothetical protein n=1 Tax=Sulfitobacter sp. TaxID=1903071 RepID=UPI003EF5C76F
TVVNVANCADVDVRFVTFKLFLCHGGRPSKSHEAQCGPVLHMARGIFGLESKIKRVLLPRLQFHAKARFTARW